MFTFTFGVVVGYVACVVFPFPGLSRWVLDKWAALGAWIKGSN